MIIFVGDRPGRKNLDPNIPFVGTQSYKKLLEWIWYLDVDINNVILMNKDEFDYDYVSCRITRNGCTISDKPRDCKIVVLGNNAEEVVDMYGMLNYFKLPHPSGLNRKLNDKKWLQKELSKCKKYLHG